MIKINNDKVYKKAVKKLLKSVKHTKYINDIISSELICYSDKYNVNDPISGTYMKYVENELKWYISEDLCIYGHNGIDSNHIWRKCASANGLVNSNYGWCIFNKNNYYQYKRSVQELKIDKHSRHATMIYSRPSINEEYNDGVHASADMICTIYTDLLIRNDTLIYIVHMRSNDVLYGLRNDLCWHQYVYKKAFKDLKKVYPELKEGYIHWNADSLHMYKNTAKKLEHILRCL